MRNKFGYIFSNFKLKLFIYKKTDASPCSSVISSCFIYDWVEARNSIVDRIMNLENLSQSNKVKLIIILVHVTY